MDLTREVRIYAVVSTVVVGAVFATSLKGQDPRQRISELDVERLNIRESDGTLRMVISNHTRFPGSANRPYAGMVFYNNEGTENGGLVFGGRRDASGTIVDAGVSLSFDKYGVPGQMVQLAGISDSQNRFAGLRVKDTAVGGPHNSRIWVGNTDDGAATVALMDAQGRKRIVLEVKADGSSSLTFLDADGKAMNQILHETAK
jgi:hypothetical protein